MSDRKILFDAARQLGADFNKAGAVSAFDRAIDQFLGIVPKGRRVSKAAVDLMHSFEGCKLTAYPDPGSKDGHPWTIGWGSTGPDIKKGVVWTQAQADARFLQDLEKFEDKVTELIGDAPTTQSQFDALVCIAYNIGTGALRNSTLLRKHKARDYADAKKAFNSWIYNDGKVMNGLVRRRKAEAELYGN